MSAPRMEEATIIREAADHKYECARCGWPVVHMGGRRFKHAASGTTGSSPCHAPPTTVVPRGTMEYALAVALGDE